MFLGHGLELNFSASQLLFEEDEFDAVIFMYIKEML